jgi:hypothetical protein
VSNYLQDVRGEDFDVVEPHWKDIILEGYNVNEHVFHDKIWDMSLTAFDKPREVQVVIDGNDRLFISVGSPGFVTFGGQNETEGMRFPLKEWIHTHPFGQAYFSGTDMKTLTMYERFLNSATVIGKGEKQTIYFRVSEGEMKHYLVFSQFDWTKEMGHYRIGEEEKCCSNCKGEEE